MKSIVQSFKLSQGRSRGCKSPVGDKAFVLFHWQTSQSLTYFFTSAFIPNQLILHSSFYKFLGILNVPPTPNHDTCATKMV